MEVNLCVISQSLSFLSTLKLQVTHQLQRPPSLTLIINTIFEAGQPSGTGCFLQNGFPLNWVQEIVRAVGIK